MLFRQMGESDKSSLKHQVNHNDWNDSTAGYAAAPSSSSSTLADSLFPG